MVHKAKHDSNPIYIRHEINTRISRLSWKWSDQPHVIIYFQEIKLRLVMKVPFSFY